MGTEWIKEISGNPYVTLGLILLAVVTFILMIIFYYRSQRIKKPFYSIRNINLIKNFDSKISSLKITIGEESIENLSISKVAFWNKGRETIRRNDITESDPLIISLNEPYKILDTKVLTVVNPANDISIRRGDNDRSVLINFEYIDANEGCVIQIIHNGVSPKDISVSGTIIGAGKPIKKTITSSSDVAIYPYGAIPSGALARPFGFILFFGGILLILAGVGFLIFEGVISKSIVRGLLFFGVFSIISSLFYLHRTIPKGLEEDFEDVE